MIDDGDGDVDGDGGGDGGRRHGLEEWCDLSSKTLLFAIHFLRFEAHLSRALFGGGSKKRHANKTHY